jgi:hypothetical protein
VPDRSRPLVALAALVVVASGLLVATRADGLLADPLGDALYAALVYALVVLVAPRTGAVRAAVVAAGLCAVVELAQLTGVPAALVQHLPAARFVVGTTFVPVDLVAYATGAALAALADVGIRRGAAREARRAVEPD